MAIQAERNGNVGVSKQFAHHLGIDVLCKEQRSHCVTQIVESDARKTSLLQQRTELSPAEVIQLHGAAHGVGKDEIVGGLPYLAERQSFLFLLTAMLAQRLESSATKRLRSSISNLTIILSIPGHRLGSRSLGDSVKQTRPNSPEKFASICKGVVPMQSRMECVYPTSIERYVLSAQVFAQGRFLRVVRETTTDVTYHR